MSVKIKRTNLPMKSPLSFTAVLLLVLDRIGAPGWAWGVAATILLLSWIAFVIEMHTEREVDVLTGK